MHMHNLCSNHLSYISFLVHYIELRLLRLTRESIHCERCPIRNLLCPTTSNNADATGAQCQRCVISAVRKINKVWLEYTTLLRKARRYPPSSCQILCRNVYPIAVNKEEAFFANISSRTTLRDLLHRDILS